MPSPNLGKVHDLPAREVQPQHHIDILTVSEVARVEYVADGCADLFEGRASKDRAAAGDSDDLTRCVGVNERSAVCWAQGVSRGVEVGGTASIDQAEHRTTDRADGRVRSHRRDGSDAVVLREDEISVLPQHEFSLGRFGAGVHAARETQVAAHLFDRHGGESAAQLRHGPIVRTVVNQ